MTRSHSPPPKLHRTCPTWITNLSTSTTTLPLPSHQSTSTSSHTLTANHPSFPPKMNISTLPRLPASQLRTLLLSPTHSPDIAIIDVRDDDHIGGHIAGSTHVPSSTLDYRVPELVRTLQRKKVVVFHCMLSQQRGPSAALRVSAVFLVGGGNGHVCRWGGVCRVRGRGGGMVVVGLGVWEWYPPL